MTDDTSTANFTPQGIIAKKRQNDEPHTNSEISWFIDQFTQGNVKDYQMTAWLMAICLNGMTDEETAALTEAMIKSGTELNWSAAHDDEGNNNSTHKVDKHSTGGVGDKVSLILQPLVASFGLTVPSMAGRGLGHTGGTIDKLESIPGFKTQYSADEFAKMILSSSNDSGEPLNVAIVSPSKDICPADRRMYALRDVTSCVRSLPLQTSSIMCKKIAERPDSLVLDVKFGKGSFNNDVEESLELAKRMIQTGELCGIATTALVTRMDEPLGVAVGNWLEVKECINIMRNYGTEAGDDFSMDLVDATLALAGQMLVQGSKANTLKEGITMARENLSNGKAWQKFRQMVIAQGGDISYIDNPEKYPPATYQSNTISPQSGYILSIDSLEIGLTGVLIGAGRKSVEDSVDFSAGILFKAKAGKFVNEGDVIAEIYSERSGEVMENAAQRVLKAVTFSEKPPVIVPLITHLVTKNGSTEFDQSNLE